MRKMYLRNICIKIDIQENYYCKRINKNTLEKVIKYIWIFLRKIIKMPKEEANKESQLVILQLPANFI